LPKIDFTAHDSVDYLTPTIVRMWPRRILKLRLEKTRPFPIFHTCSLHHWLDHVNTLFSVSVCSAGVIQLKWHKLLMSFIGKETVFRHASLQLIRFNDCKRLYMMLNTCARTIDDV